MRCYDPRLMRALVDDDVDDGSASAETGRRTRIPSWITPVAVAVAVGVGVVLRFVQRSPLWLDEALSVNIASLPVGDMLDALRHDGHPPLYYLVLHYWIEAVGDGDMAVRALSGIFAVASLPLVWLAGRRLAGTAGGRWALVVAALSPYWVRYATETRMYSLVMLLVLAGYLLLVRALDEPTWPRLGGLAVVSGLLLLTHYWAFYLCAAVGAVLVLRAWRQPTVRGATVRTTLAVAAGGLLFLPWLGGFLYQTANTGTPWGAPLRPTAIVQTALMDMGGGTFTEAYLYGSVVLVLVLVALFVARSAGHEVTLDLRTMPVVRNEMLVVAVTLAIGESKSCSFTNDQPVVGETTRTQGYWSTHMSVTRMGSVDARLEPVAYGFGFPQICRRLELSVLVGFHSANGWSQVGMPAIGTNALDTNVIGKMTVNETCWATSTVGTDRPSQTPIQAIANANSRRSATPCNSATNPVWTDHPTARPLSISTTRMPAL